MSLSKLSKEYSASMIRKIYNQAAMYEDVIYFTVGEPDFNSPDVVKETLIESLNQNNTRYGPNAGDYQFRELIATDYNNRFKTNYTADNVLITFGATEAINLVMKATLDPMDEVIIPTPNYPNYLGQLQMVGAKPVFYNLNKNNNFQFEISELNNLLSNKTKMIILNSPNNPLGTVISREKVIELAEWAEKNQIVILADEVYRQLIYENKKHYSFADSELVSSKDIYVVDSFSKTYSMTGYRVGYLITQNIQAVNAMIEFKEGIAFAVPKFIQDAASAALTDGDTYIDLVRSEYAERRKILIDGIESIDGLDYVESEGAFYLFVNISATGLSSYEFSIKFLEEKHIAVLPGSSFGDNGEGYIRVSFANSRTNIKKLIKELQIFLNKLI